MALDASFPADMTALSKSNKVELKPEFLRIGMNPEFWLIYEKVYLLTSEELFGSSNHTPETQRY